MNTQTRLQACWIWNKTVEEFVRSRVEGYSLNVCAGVSKIGDVRFDLDPADPSVVRGDMRDLPYPDCHFDTVIQDPPWKIGFYHRMRPFFECVRVCKVAGRIIYNAYWLPSSKAVELEEAWIRQDAAFTNTSVISVFRKMTADFDEKEAER